MKIEIETQLELELQIICITDKQSASKSDQGWIKMQIKKIHTSITEIFTRYKMHFHSRIQMKGTN